MSTGYSWEGIRQVRATLLAACHVPERLCGRYVYLGRYIKCSTFLRPHARTIRLYHSLRSSGSSVIVIKSITFRSSVQCQFSQFILGRPRSFCLELRWNHFSAWCTKCLAVNLCVCPNQRRCFLRIIVSSISWPADHITSSFVVLSFRHIRIGFSSVICEMLPPTSCCW